jgi:UDP-2,3-diacylglucosamine pyrophosphatase LpxH
LVQTLSTGDGHDNMDDAPATYPFRTLWLSDIHLGTRDCKAEALLDLLRHCHADTLYLVGDIIDGWQLRKGWYWPQAHNDVAQKLLRKARKGCRVVFIPGNHDEFARDFHGLHFGGIEVLSDAVHITATGARLWIVHGDWFDGVVMHAKWLAHLGDALYIFTLKLNRWLNQARHRMGFSYWSLSQYLKGKVKNAVSYISSFEQLLAEEAARRQCEGVVCGHIHRAELRQIGNSIYANCGDWVESLTAVAELNDGTLQLLMWKQSTSTPIVLAELHPGSAIASLNEVQAQCQPLTQAASHTPCAS